VSTQERAAQFKLASRSRGLNALYRGLLSILMPCFAFVAPRWNRRLLRAVGRFLATLFWKLRPKYEWAVRQNIGHVLGKPAADPEVLRLAYRMHYNHAYFWIDLFRYADADAATIDRLIDHEAAERRLMEIYGEGRGVILATAHIGNWELGGLALGKRDIPVTVVYSRDRFDEIERFRSGARLSSRVREIAVSDSPFAALPLVAALRRGEIVALQVDRDWNDRGIAVPFFGRQAFFLTGPAALARLSGAPLVYCFILHQGDGTYRLVVDGPLQLAESGDREQDIEENVGRVAAGLEPYILDHLDQWYCYYAVWEDAMQRLERVTPLVS